MNKHLKYSLLAMSIALAGCGSDSGSSSTDNNDNSGGDNTGGDVVTATYCETAQEEKGESLYFCDDFSDASTFATNWKSVGTHDGKFVIEDDILWFENGATGGQLLIATPAVASLVPESGDYYVEAKVRLRNNNSTGSKRTYLLGRYTEDSLGYSAGFNSQATTEGQRATLGYINGEGTADHTNYPFAIDMGSKHSLASDGYTVTEHSTDGTWYTIRLVMNGSEISAYVDDVPYAGFDGTAGEANSTNITDPGSIGFYSKNRAFEVDYVIIGDAADLPASVSLDVDSVWEPTIGDEMTVTVSAVQAGGDADTVTMTNSNTEVVDVTIGADNTFTLKAMQAGTAEVSFALDSDPTKVTTLSVTVNEAVVLPTFDYGDISAKVTPTVNAQDQQVDVTLSLTLEGTPTLGERGIVYIYDANTNEVVQELNVGGDVTTVGSVTSGKVRTLNYFPVVLDGNTVNIYPKKDAFTAGGEYYIAISEDVINGATLNGDEFVGLGKNQWQFSIGAAVEASKTALSVGPSGDFATVQGALNYFMDDTALKNSDKTITLEDGVYYEMLMLRNVNNLTIKGTSREGTIIRHDNHEARNGGSSGRPLMLVESADMLTFEDITLENTHRRTGSSDQAEVIYFNSNYRLVAKNANFLSEQDTILVKGYSWFYNTLVAGNVDFIWGYPNAALFENSEIRTIADSKAGSADTATDGGYVLQARIPAIYQTDAAGNYVLDEDGAKIVIGSETGFVFLNSKFTFGKGVLGNDVKAGSTYIARSGGDATYFDNVTLVNCTLDTHIADVGYGGAAVDKAPTPGIATATEGWRIDEASLAASPITNMTDEAYTLTAAEAEAYDTRAEVFAAYNSGAGWNPAE
ncbi:pectinesterase family protein [Vibrio ziniensis]|uniref:Pectinesterase catalytic domain-containing protein n=1 Tax=Vibrio ziniensis TaxID=2711221 RepID=A0A6G7CEV0_9VIBR|nr:pectinesterase family protein [Vibrio ziniensis]QIH40645.1 hypothetical protein G5S32_01045 [Vibrio ziniensis]QOT69935.1 pectinesterase [Vibrio ziniensis]